MLKTAAHVTSFSLTIKKRKNRQFQRKWGLWRSWLWSKLCFFH